MCHASLQVFGILYQLVDILKVTQLGGFEVLYVVIAIVQDLQLTFAIMFYVAFIDAECCPWEKH